MESRAATEATMRKLPHLAVALVLAILGVTVVTKLFVPSTGAMVSAQRGTISVEEIQRSIDVRALPVQQVEDPI
jgi:hypothetical protein